MKTIQLTDEQANILSDALIREMKETYNLVQSLESRGINTSELTKRQGENMTLLVKLTEK